MSFKGGKDTVCPSSAAPLVGVVNAQGTEFLLSEVVN